MTEIYVYCDECEKMVKAQKITFETGKLWLAIEIFPKCNHDSIYEKIDVDR